MKVLQIAYDWRDPQVLEYETNLTDIHDVVMEFGRSNDRVELFTDDGKMVAMADWPFGYKTYIYKTF